VKLADLFIPTNRNGYEALLLKRPMLFIYSLLLLAVNYLAPVYFPNVNTVAASSISADRLIELTNLDRRNAGLIELKRSSLLDQAAFAKAQNMFEEDYWDHFGPNGESPWQFIRATGYDPYRYAGENLAKGFSTSEGVHQAWMASPTHKENIMESNYRDIGFAVVDGYLEGEKVTLVVQMFGTLMSDATDDSGFTNFDASSYESEVMPEVPEDGDITSIRISYPEIESTINNPKVDIRGIVGGGNDTLFIEVTEDMTPEKPNDENRVIGETEVVPLEEYSVTTTRRWEYQRSIEWTQGEHKVIASIVGDKDAPTAEVSFTVDSVGPELDASLLNNVANDGYTELVYMQDEKVTGYLTIENATYPFFNENEAMVVRVPTGEYENANYISATLFDEFGNSSHTVIKNEESANITVSSVLGLTSEVGKFNFVLMAFIVVLLGLQIYYYKKLHLLQYKAGHLFTLGVFVFLIVVAVFTKNIGSIN
jgi:uncharacterized protein YkwD